MSGLADTNNRHSSVTYLEHIPAIPKRSGILTRLGYRAASTVLTDQHRTLLERGIQEALRLCQIRGAYRCIPIVHHDIDATRLANEKVFQSTGLAALLAKSSEIVLMASTAGSPIVQRIDEEIRTGNAALGVILDATASQAADAGLDWMVAFLNRMLLRQGKRLTRRRFSPGYGDLSLEYQRTIFDLLDLRSIGLDLTDTLMLVPEKSVLAIAGIEGITK